MVTSSHRTQYVHTEHRMEFLYATPSRFISGAEKWRLKRLRLMSEPSREGIFPVKTGELAGPLRRFCRKQSVFPTDRGEGRRRIRVELCDGKEEKTGEINWKIDFLFPIFNPDNIYFITQ